MTRRLPIYPCDLIPYSLYLSISIANDKKINTQGFKLTLNNKKLNSTPNIILNLDEDQIKKLEKAKRKGIGAQSINFMLERMQ